MKIEFKLKLNAQTPSKAHTTDAAFDLYSMENAIVPAGSGCKVQTGVSVNIPEGFVGLVFSRSGMGVKGIRLSNCVGVIDAGYQGDVSVLVHNDTEIDYYVNFGDKIAQIAFFPIPEVELQYVEEFSAKTARGEKGFGSTGK